MLRFKQWNGRERSLHFEPQSFYLPVEELSDSNKVSFDFISICMYTFFYSGRHFCSFGKKGDQS